MIILNFSHPITKTPALERVTGVALDQIEIIDVPCYFQLSQPLQPQVEKIIAVAGYEPSNVRSSIEAIRLPGFADAAVLVIEAFRELGFVPNVIRFAKFPPPGDPRFDAVELMRL